MPYTLPFHKIITIYKYNKLDFLTFVSHFVASDLELHVNVYGRETWEIFYTVSYKHFSYKKEFRMKKEIA